MDEHEHEHTYTGQQQFGDWTTWPCLTHALRPTHSLRSCCGNVLSKDYWQQDSKTYSMNFSSLKTTWVDSENIQPLKSEDIWLEWEVYKTSYWSMIMCKAEWQKMRLTIWKFIIKTLGNKGLNRRVNRTYSNSISVSMTKHWPTTIWWLNHMTMLNA